VTKLRLLTAKMDPSAAGQSSENEEFLATIDEICRDLQTGAANGIIKDVVILAIHADGTEARWTCASLGDVSLARDTLTEIISAERYGVPDGM
jgi:hypothetical protein